MLRTANPTPLLNNNGWTVNGVGRQISNKFGYGLMDAGAIVKLAKIWTTVPEQHMCTQEYFLDEYRLKIFFKKNLYLSKRAIIYVSKHLDIFEGLFFNNVSQFRCNYIELPFTG